MKVVTLIVLCSPLASTVFHADNYCLSQNATTPNNVKYVDWLAEHSNGKRKLYFTGEEIDIGNPRNCNAICGSRGGIIPGFDSSGDTTDYVLFQYDANTNICECYGFERPITPCRTADTVIEFDCFSQEVLDHWNLFVYQQPPVFDFAHGCSSGPVQRII